MYVCICNAIRETDLRNAARVCAGNAETLYAALGKTPQCRQCLDDADDIIADARCGRLRAVEAFLGAGRASLTPVAA